MPPLDCLANSNSHPAHIEQYNQAAEVGLHLFEFGFQGGHFERGVNGGLKNVRYVVG